MVESSRSDAGDPNGLAYATNYAYDPLGNLTGVDQWGRWRYFNYDSLSRLTSTQNPESGTVTYSYDNNGNLSQQKDNRGITTSYSYDALNRVQQQTYSDRTPAVTYSYDAQGDLSSVANGNSTTNYTSFDVPATIQ